MSKVLRYLVLLYPVVVLCSPFIFNVRFDFLYLIFITTASFFYKNKTKVSVPIQSLYVLLILLFTLFSTFFFYATNSTTKLELSLLLFWPRIFLVILLCYWSSNLFDLKNFKSSLSFFYLVLYLLLLLGFFESFKLLPPLYAEIKSFFIPNYSKFMFEELRKHSYLRSTSLFLHPSIYCYAAIFLFLTRIMQIRRSSIIGTLTLITCVIFIFIPFSKIGFIALPIIITYYFLVIKRQYIFFTLISTVLIFILYFGYNLGKTGNYGGTIFHLISYFFDSLINQGIFDSVFRTRYSFETGLLANNYNSILQNIFWGSGACMHSNIFIGDSFYITNITMYGILGTLLVIGYFILLYYINKFNLKKSKNTKLFNLFKSINFLLVLNIIIGIGLEFSSVYKFSEIFCFYTFIHYYGLKIA